MKDFFWLFNLLKNKSNAYRMQIEWNTITDFSLHVSKGDAFKSEEIFFVQAVEERHLFAQAYCKLSEYMSEAHGGY